MQPGQAGQGVQAGGAAPVRIAIAGTGNIAEVHAAALRGLPGAELVGAADIDRARLAAFGAEHGVPELHADLAGLLAAAGPDLVHLCTPPARHFEQAALCLEAGVSVLAEKPPTLSLRELDLLADLARPGGPWLATVFQHRFGSAAGRLRALAASGMLGRPLLAICHTTWFRDQAYFDVPWRGRWQTEGGGPTMGHGIHQMDLLRYVLGDWAEISAIARRQARRTETEDLSMAHVIFASGAAASVVNSVLSPRAGELPALRLRARHGRGQSPVRVPRRGLAGHPGPGPRAAGAGRLAAAHTRHAERAPGPVRRGAGRAARRGPAAGDAAGQPGHHVAGGRDLRVRVRRRAGAAR